VRYTRFVYGLSSFLLAASVASAITYNRALNVDNGVLSYAVDVTTVYCYSAGYTRYYYHGFQYARSGWTENLYNTFTAIYNPTPRGACPKTSYPSFSWTVYDVPVFPFNSQTKSDLTFQSGGAHDSASGTDTQLTPGMVYPAYQVQSIIYAAPGNQSSNGFTNTETDGVSTSVGSSFQVGDTATFSVSTGFLGTGSTLSWSYGTSTTTGDSTSVTETISDATGIVNASSGGSNAINHHQDLFVIWVNPAVVFYQTGINSVGYGVGTQLQGAGDPMPGQPQSYQRQVEVFAQAMLPNAQGVTTVPVEALKTWQAPDGEVIPGLAVACANPIYYPNSCTQQNQCGCVPNDFVPILNQNPLLNYTTTQNPMSVDTSGISACTNPSATAKCRYIPVPVAPGSRTQLTQLLCGPQSPGGNNCGNNFTQTDSTDTTETLSESLSTTVGFAVEKAFKFSGTGISFRNEKTWTWTNSESAGEINGTAHSMSVTLSSSTLDCYQAIPVFEDTVYHTFVFQQPQGDSSCP